MSVHLNRVLQEYEAYNNYDYIVYSQYSTHVLNDRNFFKKILNGEISAPSSTELSKAHAWFKIWNEEKTNERLKNPQTLPWPKNVQK